MKKRIFTVCAALSVAAAAFAQGGITDEMMSRIRQGYQDTPEERALRNAISANDINTLAVRQGVEAGYDFYFSDEVPSQRQMLAVLRDECVEGQDDRGLQPGAVPILPELYLFL